MPTCYPRWASKRFLMGASIRVGVSLLHRHRAISWYAFGVAWLSSGGGGVVLKNLFCAGLWILLKFPPGLIPVFQSSVSPSNWGGLGLAGCQLIVQTQGYQLVCIWGSLVKFQGGGVVLNFDALLHLDAVCMQAMLLLIFQVNKQLTWRL